MSNGAVLLGILLSVVLGVLAFMDKLLPALLADELPLADRVVIEKAARKLYLFKDGQVLREYSVSLGANPTGHKLQEGDSRTPEGVYKLDWRNPKSRFHLSIHVSYPNDEDLVNANRLGVDPGRNIMLHGYPNWRVGSYFVGRDWTQGCIAVSNKEMEEIWHAVPSGTPIEILP